MDDAGAPRAPLRAPSLAIARSLTLPFASSLRALAPSLRALTSSLRAVASSLRALTPSLTLAVALAGCSTTTAGRLRWVSSVATQASWSFVVDDRARGAELLVDGRLRDADCDRQGKQIRCELRGLFPGGHTVEVRLPGAILKRTAVIGRDWPGRPALVRVGSVDDVRDAARAGADGVIAAGSAGTETLQDLAEAAHADGLRLFVAGGEARAVELAAADGLVDAPIPLEVRAHFPEARTLTVDAEASAALAQLASGRGGAAIVAQAHGLVEAHGLVAAALAYVAPAGAIVDRAAFPLLQPRKRHPALKDARLEASEPEPGRFTLLLHGTHDELTLLVNLSSQPWQARPDVVEPLDLLGSHIENGALELKPNDAALVVRSPAPDKTRY